MKFYPQVRELFHNSIIHQYAMMADDLMDKGRKVDDILEQLLGYMREELKVTDHSAEKENVYHYIESWKGKENANV